MSDTQREDAPPISDEELEALRNSDSQIIQLLVKFQSGALDDTSDEFAKVVSWRTNTDPETRPPHFNHEDLAAITSQPSVAFARSLAQHKRFNPPDSVPDLSADPTPCWVEAKDATEFRRKGDVGGMLVPNQIEINTVFTIYDRSQALRSRIEVTPAHDPGGIGDRWCLIWGTPDPGEYIVVVNPGSNVAWFAKLPPAPDPTEHTHHGLFRRH